MSAQGMGPQPPVGFDEMLRDALMGEHPDYHIPFELTRRVAPELDLAPYEVERTRLQRRRAPMSGDNPNSYEASVRDCVTYRPDLEKEWQDGYEMGQLLNAALPPRSGPLPGPPPCKVKPVDQNTRAQVVQALELFAALTPNERDVVMFLVDDEGDLSLAALSTILEATAPLDENYRGELTEYADDPIGRCDLCGKKAPMAVTDRGAVCSWGCDEL